MFSECLFGYIIFSESKKIENDCYFCLGDLNGKFSHYSVCFKYDIMKHNQKGVDSMNYFKQLVFILCLMFISVISVNAATFGMSVSTKEISPNGTFTINVGGDCIGKVNLTVSNGTLSSNSVWVEQGYVSVKVTAGTSGKVIVTATPEIGFSDADANLYNPGARSVSVNIIANSNTEKPNSSGKPSTSKPTPSKKSNNNNLASLTVSLGELFPKFVANVTDYKLQLPAGTKELTIAAVSEDNKASINGNGKVNLQSGNNFLKVEVIAENGVKKIYTVNVHVLEEPVAYLSYTGEKIGIFHVNEGITLPNAFVASEYVLDNSTILLYTKGNIQLVYGINELKEKNFYLFNPNTKELESKLTHLNINNRDFLILDREEKRENVFLDTMVIGELEVDCYKFNTNGDNYCLFQVLREDGVKVEYLYEKTENTMQLYQDFSTNAFITSNNDNKIIFLLGSLLFLAVGTIFFLLIWKKGGTKNEKHC